MRRLVLVSIVIGCRSSHDANPTRAPDPSVFPPSTGDHEVHAVTIHSRDGCPKADAAWAARGADPNVPHQMNGFLGVFPDAEVTGESKFDIPVGDEVLLFDRLLDHPIKVIQRIPVTSELHAIDLERTSDGTCRFVIVALPEPPG